MKILVTTAFDAGNLAIENIVKEFISRGHKIDIYARYTDATSIRMFNSLGISIYQEEQLTESRIKEYDIAFCTVDAMWKLRLADIYVFSYNWVADTWVSEGADFMFTMVRNRNLRISEDCAFMPIGDAKHYKRSLPKNTGAHSKQFLYIDAGHNPFGYQGKCQVAKLLLDICEKFPSYDLVVKPRWIPGEEVQQTHQSRLHLYSILNELTNGNLPHNLILLNEHRNLQELIEESVSVITTSISSYIDVALSKKGCIVIDGLSSEEEFSTRNAFRDAYEDARQAGCCADYKEVIQYLPEGLQCNAAYLRERIPCVNEVPEKIVDVVEYVFEKILSAKQYPEIRQYEYHNFKDVVRPAANISIKELKYRRFKNAMIYKTRVFEQFKARIDYTSLIKTIEAFYNKYPLSKEGFQCLNKEINKEIDTLIIRNSDICMQDPIDQALLLQRMFDAEYYSELLALNPDQITCNGPYHYYLGMIQKNKRNVFVAMEHFCKFLMEANSRSFHKYPQEMNWGIGNAYNYIFENFDGSNIEPLDFANLYIALYQDRTPTIVNYKNRVRAHNYLPKLSEQLLERDMDLALKCLRLYARWEYHYNIRPRDEQIKAMGRSKLYHVDQVLRRILNKLRGGMRCYREHGLRYTWRRGIEKIRKAVEKKLAHNTCYRIWRVFQQRVLHGYELYADVINEYGTTARLFLSAAATGDAYIFGTIFKSYVQNKYPASCPVYGVFGQSGCDVAKLFGIKHVRAFSTEEFHSLWTLTMFDTQQEVHLESMHYHIFWRHTMILSYVEGLHGFDEYSLIKAVLGIQSPSEIEAPVFEYDQEYLKSLFLKTGLVQNKTVLLSPYAKSVKSIPFHFWNRLASLLIDKGFCVCTNSANDRELPVERTIPISVPYAKIVPFLEQAGVCISLRSGFSDVTSSAKCLKITLFVKNDYERSMVCPIKDSWSVVGMYGQPNQFDMIYSPETEEILLEQIVQKVISALNNNKHAIKNKI